MTSYEQISVTPRGQALHVKLKNGRIIDQEDIQKLGDELLSLVDPVKPTAILLDFQGVNFLSSAALGKLIKLNNRVNALKGQLRLAAIGPNILEVFKITKLDETFHMHPTVEEALDSF